MWQTRAPDTDSAHSLPTAELKMSLEKLRQSAEELFSTLEKVEWLALSAAEDGSHNRIASSAALTPAHDHEDGGSLLEAWHTR
jgi:hypothetical protein